jgi:DNA-binding PucR family transcriptional regulator
MSTMAVAAGIPADRLAGFAELVFAYIDELSAASVAGHTDELATTGRVRERLLERLAADLLDGATSDQVQQSAARAEYSPPSTLTAVIVPEAQARSVRAVLPGVVLQAVDRTDIPDDWALLLVPDAHGRRRAALLDTLPSSGCIAGPARPWLQVRASYDRALRARSSGLSGDTEDHLTRLVLTADPEALADLRARALAPLADLRPAVAEKLTDTLRSWLLHQGRREDVAAELFVHPQTVRYRMGQIRELYGDRLDDPATVVELTIALS